MVDVFTHERVVVAMTTLGFAAGAFVMACIWLAVLLA